jgi:ABC-type branched-subunit amino acid transport system ATPase component
MNGEDITGEPAEQLVRRGVVLVEGGRSVFADMTVAENLEVQSLTLRTDRKLLSQRRERVFRTFPALTDRLSQKAGTLSGGEQQQLALAKAILLNPQVLCIDELSLGLAPVVVQELLGIVKSIHREGTTVILVEQSLNIAADICERALFMEKGTVRFEGSTRDLLERDDIARAVFLGSA